MVVIFLDYIMCKQDENKTKFVGHSKVVLGLRTRKLALAGLLAGGKHNTLSADLCNGNKTSCYYRMRACGIRIENRLGEPGRDSYSLGA